MKDNPVQSPRTDRRPAAGKVIREALLVVVIGTGLALVANQLSPRGLSLVRNYFPTGTNALVRAVAGPTQPPLATGTNPPAFSQTQFLSAQLKQMGLQAVGGPEAARLFHDPRLLRNRIVFIDARDEPRYAAGHIPGAYELDPYHPEKYLAAVLPVCQAAEQVVVYCNGGDCDDSESAAILLRDVGIASVKLFVYGGGFAEWMTNGLPIETGARNRGQPPGTGK